MEESSVQFLGGKIPWRQERLPTPVFLGFPCGSAGKKKKKKNPPAMWDTWVWSLGCEHPLEKGMAINSSILAWRIPSTVHRSQIFRHHWANFAFTKNQMLYNLLQVGSLHQWFGGSYWIPSNEKNGMNWNIIWRSILPCQDYPWLSVINSKLY